MTDPRETAEAMIISTDPQDYGAEATEADAHSLAAHIVELLQSRGRDARVQRPDETAPEPSNDDDLWSLERAWTEALQAYGKELP